MTQTKKILFVEDQEDIQAVARIALETVGGFTVEICSNGSLALTRALEFKPDLLLLDVMMPGMDGPETLKKLRELKQTADTPVIFMTAKVQQNEVESLMKLGARGVISKPFDPMKLADSIREILEE